MFENYVASDKYQVNEVYRQMNMFDDLEEQDVDEDMEHLDE